MELTKTTYRYKRFCSLLVVASVMIFALIYYISFENVAKSIDIEDLPLITRDPSYVRIVPQDRGGKVFSNQDKEIYNSIASSSSKLLSRKSVIDGAKDTKTFSELIAKIQSNSSQRISKPLKENIKKNSNQKTFKNVFDVVDVKEIELENTKSAKTKR